MDDGGIGESSLGWEIPHRVCEESKFEFEIGIVRIVGEGSCLHDVESHNVGLLNQGREGAVTAPGIGSDNESPLVGFEVTERSESEVGSGIGKDAMRVLFKGG